MAKITQAIFLYLAGKTPAQLKLPQLKTSRSTFAALKDCFKRYLADGVEWTYCEDLAVMPPNLGTGLTVVYLMGHAWLRNGTFATAVVRDNSTVEVSGAELISLLSPYLNGPGILSFDTCNAASIAPVLEHREFQGIAAVFGSAAGESALEFPIDSATRLALALDGAIQCLPADIDFSELAIQTIKEIQSSAVMAPQTVSYLPARPPILLSKVLAERGPRAGSRTYIIVRALLVSIGIALACVIAGVLWYWRSHVQVEIQAPSLPIVEGPLKIELRNENPDSNTSELVESDTLLPGNTLRLRVSAGDLLFLVNAKFRDAQSRAIRFHTVSGPTFSPASKFLHFDLPGSAEIASHPNMAYVPATRWLAGPDRTISYNREGYWIDLYPPIVSKYLPEARAAVAQGLLQDYESVLGYWTQSISATTGTTQMGRPARRRPQALSDNQVTGAHVPCPNCPAPMTIEEAILFCKMQGKLLPTASESELAARGTDGRLYPWGNRFEKTRANVTGLPEKGEKVGLKSVYDFPTGESPFGIFGAVGNAGQWIDSQGGYERTFIGGSYRFDPRDSVVYSTMPDTGDVLPYFEVTVRCVSSSKTPASVQQN